MDECKADWNEEELDKPKHERIPLPKPTSDFQKLYNAVQQLIRNPKIDSDHESADEPKFYDAEGEEDENEDEEEEEESEDEKQPEPNSANSGGRIQTESDSNIENSLVPCPNCKRTFFPERLNIHMKSCKPGKPMKNTVGKKPVYQPPKPTTKSKWVAPTSNDNSDNSENESMEERKAVGKSKATKAKSNSKPTNMTNYNKFADSELDEDPRHEYSTTNRSKTKNSTIKKGGTAMKTNTVTTFSRLEEERDERDAAFNEMADDDNRVPCENCGRKFNPDRLPIHQKS